MKKVLAKYYQIQSERITPSDFPTRIVFISDLHNVEIGERNEVLFNKIEQLNPDLVLLGGDTIVGKPNKSMEAGLDFIKTVGKHFNTYAANGNHEYRLKVYPEVYGDMYERYLAAISEAGITLLENKSASVTINGSPMVIHGLEIDRKYYGRFNRPNLSVSDIEDYLGKIEDEKYHILLAHNPRFAKSYMQWGAQLTLSGHYHGGIIRLANDKPLIGNDIQILPPFAYGHHTEDDKHIITSAGLGEHTIPLRINNPRELVVVDLINK